MKEKKIKNLKEAQAYIHKDLLFLYEANDRLLERLPSVPNDIHNDFEMYQFNRGAICVLRELLKNMEVEE